MSMFSPFIFVSLLLFHGAVCDWEEESDEEFALKYLSHYNYLSRTRSGNHDHAKAIKRFQKFFGLPVTGRLDEATINEMRQPRCGVPDVDVHDERLRVRRSWLKSKWSKTDLKYYLSYGEDLSESDQSRIFAAAFQVWRNAAPKLKFTRTYSLYNADFKISFGKGRHSGLPTEGSCYTVFDGKGGVLAHANPPEDGGVHFDEDEKFSETGSFWRGSQSLIYVAAHEIGHALGLHHTNVKGTVMFPIARRGKPKLHKDDIAKIKKLYG